MRRVRPTYLLLALAVSLAGALALWPATVSAHLAGQAPYFKINGKYISLYPIQNPDTQTLELPQTDAPERYLTGVPIQFELQPYLMSVPDDGPLPTKFRIDFGDGNSTAKLQSAHTYREIGSYIVEVRALDGGGPRIVESVLVHVVPDAGYKLPSARIKINGQVADDRSKPYEADLAGGISLEAVTEPSTARVVRYQWDLADGGSSRQQRVEHSYAAGRVFAMPVLRVYDANGLFTDTSLDITNDRQTATSDGMSGAVGSFSLSGTYHALKLKAEQAVNGVFKDGGTNYWLAFVALAAATVAGGLHSLTPGHGKAVMAALLVGRRGSKRADVATVAAAITFTHTVVIFGLGFAFLVLDASFSLPGIVGYLEKVSAGLILILAVWLIYSGVKKLWHQHQHQHHHRHPGPDDFSALDKDGHRGSRWELFLAGSAGGIIPCIDALALLLLAVSLGHTAFGLLLVLAFSIGLAASISAIGLLLLAGRQRIVKDGRLVRLADVYTPITAGTVIFVLAVLLLLA